MGYRIVHLVGTNWRSHSSKGKRKTRKRKKRQEKGGKSTGVKKCWSDEAIGLPPHGQETFNASKMHTK